MRPAKLYINWYAAKWHVAGRELQHPQGYEALFCAEAIGFRNLFDPQALHELLSIFRFGNEAAEPAEHKCSLTDRFDHAPQNVTLTGLEVDLKPER